MSDGSYDVKKTEMDGLIIPATDPSDKLLLDLPRECWVQGRIQGGGQGVRPPLLSGFF